MVAGRTVDGLRWLEVAALVAPAGVVSYALATGSARRHYDVDEIQHTHVMWRIAVGDRPFHDFVESHPPFVWYLGAPLLRWASGPASAIAGFRVASEIAAHPPALIVSVGGGFNLPATQENVVARYVRDHGAEYVTVPLAGKLGLLVRRDQADWDYLEAAGLLAASKCGRALRRRE